MLNLKKNAAKVFITIATAVLIFMPVVRAFYGLNIANMHRMESKLNSAPAKHSSLFPVVRNISWSLIRERKLSQPPQNRFNLIMPVIIISFLLFFFAQLKIESRSAWHSAYRSKPRLSHLSVYLVNRRLLI